MSVDASGDDFERCVGYDAGGADGGGVGFIVGGFARITGGIGAESARI